MIKIMPLTDKEIKEKVVNTIKEFLPDCKVILIGSRAKGTFRKQSDYDIVIKWRKRVPTPILSKILDKIETLDTLKTIDLCDFYDLPEEMRNIKGVVLYDGTKDTA